MNTQLMQSVETLIKQLNDNQWNTAKIQNLDQYLVEITKDSKCVAELCRVALSVSTHVPFFGAILAFLNKEDFAQLIDQAMELALAKGKTGKKINRNIEEIVSQASFQFPELLHKHLVDIVALKIIDGAYYAENMFCHLPKAEIEPYLKEFLTCENKNRSYHLFLALLATKDKDTIHTVCAHVLANKTNIPYKSWRRDVGWEEYLAYHLEIHGLTLYQGIITNFCPAPAYHLVFVDGYLDFSDDGVMANPLASYFPVQHPTWQYSLVKTLDDMQNFTFGGVMTESDDDNPFSHIMTFSPIPDWLKQNLPITGLDKLSLGCHFSELNSGYSPLFYRHDENGIPHKIIDEDDENEIDDLDAPLKAGVVALQETPERWQQQDWAISNGRESLFRVGGEPTWIQGAEVPNCPITGKKMCFLMQLDSGLPTDDEGAVWFGSGGICYVFWCDESKVSAFIIQCT